MRPFLLVGLASTIASQVFEAPDFDVTEALIEQGVDVSSLPRLSGLISRSSNQACDTAVSIPIRGEKLRIELTTLLVFLARDALRKQEYRVPE